MKTRSPLYLRQMSDKVNSALDRKAKDVGVAKWVLVEKVLENHLGIVEKENELDKFIGVNRHNARLGKPNKKKATK